MTEKCNLCTARLDDEGLFRHLQEQHGWTEPAARGAAQYRYANPDDDQHPQVKEQ